MEDTRAETVSYTHLDVYKRQPEIQLGAAVAQPCAAQGVQLLGGMGGGVQLVQHIGEQVQVCLLYTSRCV